MQTPGATSTSLWNWIKKSGSAFFGYAGLCADIENLFPAKVDVVNAKTVKPRYRESILSEAVYAF
jgi:predicted nucleotidyltransferase